MVRATVYLWMLYLPYSNVWLTAHHIMHISSSTWHRMHTSCTFLWLGAHHIIFWIYTRYMKMIVLCLSMISKRFADYQSADSRMQQARWKNKIREEFVYALYSLMFDYAFVHAHDLIRTTWCRRIWIHASQPDRTMKQEIHLWNTALAPDASHHAHDLMRTTWCTRIWIHAL